MAVEQQTSTEQSTEVREGLKQFCSYLANVLKDNLVSVVLYGSLAKGEYETEITGVNVMVVLQEATIDALEHTAPIVQRGRRDFGLTVLMLSEQDLRRSTDVFPIKFLDMQQHHELLYGQELLAELTIGREHLRLRCEQELKNLLLRLRMFYLLRAHLPERVEATLLEAAPALLVDLRVALSLKGVAAPGSKEGVVTAAARELGLAEGSLQQVLALATGKFKPDAAALKQLYGEFMAAVEQAAAAVDAL